MPPSHSRKWLVTAHLRSSATRQANSCVLLFYVQVLHQDFRGVLPSSSQNGVIVLALQLLQPPLLMLAECAAVTTFQLDVAAVPRPFCYGQAQVRRPALYAFVLEPPAGPHITGSVIGDGKQER